MREITLIQITKDDDIIHLADIANEVWHEFFPGIITVEQVDYMVDKFQSYPAIKKQMEEGYEYYFIMKDDKVVGYTGIHEDKDTNKLFLSKLYLIKANRGKGYAGHALRSLYKIAEERKLDSIYLTVNKHNDNTIEVYEHMGFVKVRTQTADIGNGFVMDDFIMEKEI